MKGIILVGHGSRSKESKELFFKIVEGLRRDMKNENIEGCFMEISKPNIPERIEDMYKKGVRDFVILPYFLIPGIHIKRDIPNILNEVKNDYEDISLLLSKPIGYHPKLIEILKERSKSGVKIT